MHLKMKFKNNRRSLERVHQGTCKPFTEAERQPAPTLLSLGRSLSVLACGSCPVEPPVTLSSNPRLPEPPQCEGRRTRKQETSLSSGARDAQKMMASAEPARARPAGASQSSLLGRYNRGVRVAGGDSERED